MTLPELDLAQKLKLSHEQVLAFSRDFVILFKKEQEDRQRLEEANEKLKAIMDSISDFLIATDRDFRIKETNLRAREFLSAEGQPIQYVGQLIPEEILQQKVTELLLAEKGIVRFELKYEKNPGQVFSVTIARINHPGNSDIGFLFTFRDISEAKGLERLRKKVAQLATLEVEAPFQGLLGLLDLLFENIQNRLTSEELAYFHFLRQSGKNLQKILHQMVHLNPVYQDSELEKSLVQLDGLVLAALDECKHEIQANDIEVRFEAECHAAVWMDQELMKKAVSALLRNLANSLHEPKSLLCSVEKEGAGVLLKISARGIPDEKSAAMQQEMKKQAELLDLQQGTDTMSLSLIREVAEWNGARLEISDAADFDVNILFPTWIKVVKDNEETGR